MTAAESVFEPAGEAPRDSRVRSRRPSPDEEIRTLVDRHFDFIWRGLRRLGLSSADADDATQQVFVVAARKLDKIEPGRERAFLFGTAVRVASDFRRALRRRPEFADEAVEAADPSPCPEQLTEQRRARRMLDELLESMPLELRTVFVLFELEEVPVADIATLVGIPAGTVASRLRRARELFRAAVKRARAKDSFKGGVA